MVPSGLLLSVCCPSVASDEEGCVVERVELVSRVEVLRLQREVHEARLRGAEEGRYRGWRAVVEDARKCLAKLDEWEREGRS